MKTYPFIRQVGWVLAFVSAVGWTSAHADIYRWVDSSGNVNLSNRPPPEGAKVTSVYREDPEVRASAEAARAAAEREELRALNERVKQLEQDLEAAKQPAPAPVVYAPANPAPPPAPYPPLIVQTIVPAAQPTYSDCSYPWSGCFSPGNFGFYPSGIVVVNSPGAHRNHPARRAHPAPAPAGGVHAPLNLFGDGRPLNLFGPSRKAQGISR